VSGARLEQTPPLSVVIPVRNDAAALAAVLDELARVGSPVPEILVVDGGSDDGSEEAARRAGARVIRTSPGRGRQLSAGCAAAGGRWLWLLHADSRNVLPALRYLQGLALEDRDRGCWGRFEVAFQPSSPGLAIVARAMAWRSRLTGICTGDQGVFVRREVLERIGGVPEQPLMEDVELTRRLKRQGRPLCPPIALTTSSRRWLRDGLLRTILRMWGFRLRYWLGADPEVLARSYYG
jgi:rSAM/selenodomain-associated transferase 2